jgi:hypothetical protein
LSESTPPLSKVASRVFFLGLPQMGGHKREFYLLTIGERCKKSAHFGTFPGYSRGESASAMSTHLKCKP